MDKTKLNKHFILASSSKRRLDLLGQIGVKPDLILSPNIEEKILYKELPRKYVARMSLENIFSSIFGDNVKSGFTPIWNRSSSRRCELDASIKCLFNLVLSIKQT